MQHSIARWHSCTLQNVAAAGRPSHPGRLICECSAVSRKAPVTAQQVARLAGVSPTTVSFVLNDVRDQGIRPATRQRVLEAAARLGYQPNANARSLASGSTATVALVVPRLDHLYDDHFLAQLLASVNAECHRFGLKLLLESAEHDSATATGFVSLARTRRIDGLIVVNPRQDQLVPLAAVAAAGIPLVLLGQAAAAEAQTGARCVGQDTRIGARLAVSHLIGLGHMAIAYIGFAGRAYVADAEREQGWRDTLTAAGIAPRDDLLEFGALSAISGYQAMQRLLAAGGRPTALFAGNDTIAFGALRALQEAGWAVPQDCAVVGYDDIPLAAFAAPALTTVRTDALAHGRIAMQALAGLLGLSAAPSVTVTATATPSALNADANPVPALVAATLPAPELIVRASCGVRSPAAG